MPAPQASARLLVDLDALAANYRLIAREARGAEVAPVVKADGYGLGAAVAARRLWAEGARSFFTARPGGGEALRAALGPEREATIYVLDGCPDGWAERMQAADLVPVLNSLAQVAAWGAAAAAGGPGRAALHVDTGMNRLGLRPEEAQARVDAPDRLRGLEITMVMSHLACASDPAHPMNARQAETFRSVARLFPEARASLANSAGVFLGEEYRFDLVRPGIALYGGGPQERPDPRIAPVATLEAEIMQVRTVPPGETVGYGATWTAERPTRAAVIAVGYADGVLRSASSPHGRVFFDGALRPVLGRVSMDLVAVDVTGSEAAAPGAWVQLFGPDLPIDDAAATAGTLAYELLTRLGPRLDRIYRGAIG
jgi:alanine racemase